MSGEPLDAVVGPGLDPERDAHRSFLNRYYGVSRYIYDLTRKYYLFGRDRALEQLLASPWERLVEVGPGTGRNLRYLHACRPSAAYGAIEASDAMIEHARPRCPFARIEHGFAEDADLVAILGARPDRILFSYCLSMVPDPARALAHARRSVAPGGEVLAVDFGDLVGVPTPLRGPFEKWLDWFHVHPVDWASLEPTSLERGPLGYYAIGHFSPLS